MLRATAQGYVNEAQFELDGGPGLAVVETAPFYATDGAMYRESRDIVFVDMRGTGGYSADPAVDLACIENMRAPDFAVE